MIHDTEREVEPPLIHSMEIAANRLGVSYDWLSERVRARSVPHRRLGRLVKFTDADLEAIVEQMAVAQVTDAPAGVSARTAARLSRMAS